MDADRFEDSNYRYQTRPNNYNWHYSDRKTRRYDQNDYLGFRPEHSSYNRYDHNYRQNNSWKKRGLHKYNRNRVYNNQSIQERSTFEWIKQYEDMLWDTYEDVKLESFKQNESTNNDSLRFFSNFEGDAKDEDAKDSHEIPEEIIVQQKRLLGSRKNNVCIRCLKIHPQEHCRKTRCRICSSRFHNSHDCPWNTDPDRPIRLCESCNGGNYYLNSRLDFSAYRRLVCSNYYDNKIQGVSLEMAKDTLIHPCIKKGYEDSILVIGDKDSTQKITDLDIECYNCSGAGHIICKGEVPFKDIIKKAYCALCGNLGHNYQLCNRFKKVRFNENFSGYNNLGNSQYYYSDENEYDGDNKDYIQEEFGNNKERGYDVEEEGYGDNENEEGSGDEVDYEEFQVDGENYGEEDSYCESDGLGYSGSYDEEEYMENDCNKDELIERASVSSLRKAVSGSCDSEILTSTSEKIRKTEQARERMSNASKSIERDFSYSERCSSVSASSDSEADMGQTNEAFYIKNRKSQTENGVNPFHKFQRARIYYKNKSLFRLMGNCHDCNNMNNNDMNNHDCNHNNNNNYNYNNDNDNNNNNYNNNYNNNNNINNYNNNNYNNNYNNNNMSESKDKSTSVRSKNIHKSKKKSRRSASRTRRKKMGVIPPECCEKLIFQGAEARIYETTLLNRKVVIKHRFEKKYRHPQLDKSLRTNRILRESRNLVKCYQKGINCPNVHFVDVENGIIIMDCVQGITLNDYLNDILSNSNNYDSKLSDVSISIGNAISNLHSQIIHGDLTTSNIIINDDSHNSQIIFIDFGLSYSDSLTIEDKAVDLYVLERSLEVTHPNIKIMDNILKTYCEAHPNGKSILSKYKQELNRKVKINKVKLENITFEDCLSSDKKWNERKMLLKVFYFVFFLSYLVVNLKVNAFLRNDLTDNYIQEYLDKIYLERDLVYFDDEFSTAIENNSSIETSITNNLLKVHKSQVLNNLGGPERLINLMKLLESDIQEEEEELIDEGIELKDNFDKVILSSNLDNNYYHYVSEIEGRGFERFDDIGTNRLRISFMEAAKNISIKRMIKSVKEYEFKFKVDEIIDQKHKVIRELDQKEMYKYIPEDFIKYSNGYYLVKKRSLKENKTIDYKYSIKIESPMEIIDLKELVLFDEIRVLYNKNMNFKLDNNVSYSSKGESNLKHENEDGYEQDEDYEVIEEDYESKEEYQKAKVAKNLLTRSYPVCELKCVIRDLQNRVQWTEKIGKFLNKRENDEDRSEANIINSYNWCDRLVFHNCIGFELESMEISIMNEKLREKVHLVENILDPMVNGQIEKYFNNIFTDLVSKTLKPNQIGKIISLNEILESNGFIISKNRKNKNNEELLIMKYEKISKFSQNIISLKQILEDTKYKLRINHLNKGFAVLSSSYKTLLKEEYQLVNIIKPVTKQKFVLDIEQVLILIQNILFVLKYEKANHSGIFLPWYNKSTRNGLTKQSSFINSLFLEYLTLIKLFNRQKFYSKDRFYRFNTFNIYSLISHYKSYETDNYKNKFGKVVYSSEIQVFVVNTSLTYYDQARINSVFKGKSTHLINDFDMKIKVSDVSIVDLKYLKEYFIPFKYEIEQDDEEIIEGEDFGISESYFKNAKSIKAYTGIDHHVIEAPKLIKKFAEIKGNIDFDPNDLVFKNNLSNFGFNIAFINYIYQNSLNLDDSIITSPPWWMVWQSQFYPRLSMVKSAKEQDISLMENPDEFLREMNSTWLELPVNSENPNSFLDLSSFVPKEIISKEILESVILEEVELVNPAGLNKGDLNFSSKNDNNILEIINEKQQFYISKWKKIDVINDPSNLFFYNLFSKKQSTSVSSNFNSSKFYFNPCIINIFSESNNNSEWLANCNAKWKIYSILFEQFTSTINHYLSISTFFNLLNEIKILILIQSQTK
ncbi:uncharacterized protein ELE39_000234 [Cryptosporidium sp. chipmunk genotype I]|uniref:uncharacterized protein n=1 Tax=Cryptosporidium sp. chipmunk genotype I TaxID=1280935 RepID=UPI00351A1ED9|nr:hypothetical protein ELE39_000234 [Cryptosporidium sp. chipmunk genotype I]